jgi:hypothetical protein
LDNFPIDLLLPLHSGSPSSQRNKDLPTSATGNKYQCYDTESINYKS